MTNQAQEHISQLTNQKRTRYQQPRFKGDADLKEIKKVNI